MAKLIDLSTEVLFVVVAYFTSGDASDVQALLHLCRTSRMLVAVAQPALYTCVRLAEPAPDLLRNLKLFLKTSLEYPELAKKTRELILFNDRGIGYKWPSLRRDDTFMRLSALIGGYDGEIEPDLCYKPLALYVLARVPNVQHVRLEAQIEHPRALLQQMHEKREADTSFLANLKTFHLHKQYESGPINLRDYLPLMYYPSFERFSTESDVSDVAGECPATNTVTHATAELFWSLGPLSIIKKLLCACPRLTVFKLVIPDGKRHSNTMWDVAHQPLVCPQDLVKALLEKHSRILETLHLDFRYYYNLSDPMFQEDLLQTGVGTDAFIYPSLRGFERLSHMTIEFEKLEDFCNLPTSLKFLELENCQFAALDATYLQNLARLKETWCPSIEHVEISGRKLTDEVAVRIREHAILLNLPVDASMDERRFIIQNAGYQLQIQSTDVSGQFPA